MSSEALKLSDVPQLDKGSLRWKQRTTSAVDLTRQILAQLNVAILIMNSPEIPPDFVAQSESLELSIRNFANYSHQKLEGTSQQIELLLSPLSNFKIIQISKVLFSVLTGRRILLLIQFNFGSEKVTKQNVK
jgi:hypothetical protein